MRILAGTDLVMETLSGIALENLKDVWLNEFDVNEDTPECI